MRVHFEKYEGLGNDFIVLEAASEREVPESWARALCDRRRGIGADGLLLVLPAEGTPHDARMRVINADGSVPEMCGNGLRRPSCGEASRERWSHAHRDRRGAKKLHCA
jgi:diaminopimelate epimerase